MHSLNTNNSNLTIATQDAHWGLAQPAETCSYSSTEKIMDRAQNYMLALLWLQFHNILPGNPQSIVEKYLNKQKESLRNSGSGQCTCKLNSSSLLTRRNRLLSVQL